MKKIIKILTLFFTLIFLYSCGSAQEALVGKKRSEQGDEFLINKKNPLSMPPDFDKLPEPGKEISNIKNEEEDTKIKNLLVNKEGIDDEESIIKCDPSIAKCESSDIEKLLIEKLK
tara:strand:- start:213 stop:560 length:348 start_codon:yes stop_codon:yes gene_type:complete